MCYKLSEKCPYCGSEVIKTTNDEIYGRKFGNGMCYKCTNCDAYVGCHNSGKPLGRLSNKELRGLKNKCHAMFDTFWVKQPKKRNQYYQKLADEMGVKKEECHFGYFGKEELIKAIEIIKEWEVDK